MKVKILILALIVCFSIPATGHAFGLLKYLGDALSNQLGLDRGPIPKVAPRCTPKGPSSYEARQPGHVYRHQLYMQAEGF